MPFHPTHPTQPFLLAADVDGTLLGDPEGEALLKAFAAAHPGSFRLAMVTGRPLASVAAAVAEGRLPQPDFICGFVGTELLDTRDPANALGQRYASLIPPDWDAERLYALGEGQGILRQDFSDGQPRFQVGFDWDGQPATLAAFRQRLAAYPACRILPSYNQYIDVLPPALGKGQVVGFLQEQLGLPPERVVVAGDAGNDRQMFETPYRGIVVSNALEELKSAASQPWHYHSPLPAARGVLDGLRHFGFVEGV